MTGNKKDWLIQKYVTHGGVVRTTNIFWQLSNLININAHWIYKQQKNAWNKKCMNRHEN